MDSPKFIENPELYSLYEKIELYIRSNFPSCMIDIHEKSVSFGYPNEYTRIFLYQDKEQTSLILKISQDLTQSMKNQGNGQLYKIHTMEDVQYIKSGIRVILECRVPKVIVSGTKPTEQSQTTNNPKENANSKNSRSLLNHFPWNRG